MPSGHGIHGEWQKLFPPDYFTVLFLSLPTAAALLQAATVAQILMRPEKGIKTYFVFLNSLFKILTSNNLFQSHFF